MITNGEDDPFNPVQTDKQYAKRDHIELHLESLKHVYVLLYNQITQVLNDPKNDVWYDDADEDNEAHQSRVRFTIPPPYGQIGKVTNYDSEFYLINPDNEPLVNKVRKLSTFLYKIYYKLAKVRAELTDYIAQSMYNGTFEHLDADHCDQGQNMKLVILKESQTPDAFNDKANELEEYKGLLRSHNAYLYMLEQERFMCSALTKDGTLITGQEYRMLTTGGRPGLRPQGEFTQVTFQSNFAPKPAFDDYYVDLASSNANKALNLAAANKRIVEHVEKIKKRIRKLGVAASGHHVETTKSNPQTTADEVHAIFYYDGDMKKKWIHNPVTHFDKPHYAGSPEHYDWSVDPKMRRDYMMLTHWLEKYDLGPFTKLYAGVESGKPSIVAVAARHAVVWQYHDGDSTVYCAKTGGWSASKLDGLEVVPFGNDQQKNIGVGARDGMLRLDKDGNLVQPTKTEP